MKYSPILAWQEAVVPVVNSLECSDIWYQKNKVDAINPRLHICAGGDGAESCQGDSGGPLILANKDGRWERDIAVGVTSFGNNKCGDPDSFPTAYTRLQVFMNLLEPVVKDNPPVSVGDAQKRFCACPENHQDW